MTNLELADSIMDLALNAEALNSMAGAIYDAMEYSPNAAEDYFSAMWMLRNLLHEHGKQLCSLQRLISGALMNCEVSGKGEKVQHDKDRSANA